MNKNTLIDKYAEIIEEGALDDLVHDLKSREASFINNDGLESQLEYIVNQMIGPNKDKSIKDLLDPYIKKG